MLGRPPSPLQLQRPAVTTDQLSPQMPSPREQIAAFEKAKAAFEKAKAGSLGKTIEEALAPAVGGTDEVPFTVGAITDPPTARTLPALTGSPSIGPTT